LVYASADADSIRYVIRTGRLGLFRSLGAFVVFVTAACAGRDPLCGRPLVEYPALICRGLAE
jgi:hypothetical protein